MTSTSLTCARSCTSGPPNEGRSPANAASPNISDRGALQRGRVPHQNVRPRPRNGRLGKAKAAFGGCNVQLDSAAPAGTLRV